MKPIVSPTAARAALVALTVVALATAASAQTPPTFSVRGPSEIGEANPREAVAADIDHDGDLDLLVTTSFQQAAPASHRVNILVNDGTGMFTRQNSVQLPLAGAVAVADFNNDGVSDMAATSAGSAAQCGGASGTAIYLGSPNLATSAAFRACLTGVANPTAVQAGDFNRDGRVDLAVAPGVPTSNMMIYRGNGDGTFLPGQVVNSSNLIVQDMAAPVDVNRDGFLDLVVGATNTFRAFLGRPDGTFDAGGGTVTGDNTLAVAVTDLNADGIQDLASIEVIAGAAQMRVRRGIGNGSFPIGDLYPLGPGGVADLAIGDLDGDADMDIAVAGGSLLKARLFLNNASGVFSPGIIASLAADPYRVITGDYNGDRFDDVAMISPRQVANAQVFAALQDDRLGPTVDITAPADGSTVSGMVTISATASDNSGVSRVEFFVNGDSIGSSNGPSFSAPWDTSAISGAFTITARAFDAAHNTGEDTVSVIVADQVNPTVDITSPAAGAVRGVVGISATAADNVGVTRVDFFANDMLLGSSPGPNYTFNWDASALAGNFTIRARAFDAAGNFGDDSVSVTVVDIAAPSAATNLTGRSLRNFHAVQLNWTAASDNVGVDHYRLYELVKLSGKQMEWELVDARIEGTTTVAEIRNRRGQAHTFAIIAVDAAGNESVRSEPVEVSRDDNDRGNSDRDDRN